MLRYDADDVGDDDNDDDDDDDDDEMLWWGMMLIMMMMIALLLPIRKDHSINKHFIAENIKINEFYNNLNKKFNTDEEI